MTHLLLDLDTKDHVFDKAQSADYESSSIYITILILIAIHHD